MRIVAGERAVHISMTYEDAERILVSASSSGWSVMRELERKLRPSLEHGKKHGYPKPPLPKTNVAHDSDVKIVVSCVSTEDGRCLIQKSLDALGDPRVSVTGGPGTDG